MGLPCDDGASQKHLRSLSTREACLSQHAFVSLDDARKRIEAWRTDYNSVRPHRPLRNLAAIPDVVLHVGRPGWAFACKYPRGLPDT
ncbi:integrase core domain-containing protein [Paraburkholderia silviterrae]|uniref:Integrase catalytic domain-containing protein n=1 Tax=Paraburkholderia silviterrae TaxID=2528715 RepID=A0A4R5LYS2_9BURK|nr:hypothetical protein EYW47_38430 [Paraburkholderia silviterrae]